MSEGIVVLLKDNITFSNNAFKKIIQNIQFDDNEEEIDIFDYKLFSVYRQDDLVDNHRKKRIRKKPKN